MIASPNATPDNSATFARAVLAAAAEVEAAENNIRAVIIAAARAGDCPGIIDIVTRWQTVPAIEVLKTSTRTGGNGLAPCGQSEVQESECRRNGEIAATPPAE